MAGAAEVGVVAAEAAIKIVELAEKQGWLDRLRTAWKKKHRILVLGASGAGKTNLLDSLTSAVPKAIDALNRTEFAERRSIRVARQPFIFVDTPGQQLHSSRRVRAIREGMSAGLSGVLNVVSYGYHETRMGKREAFTRAGEVGKRFLEDRRADEIAAVREWAPILGDRDVLKWLITVVTKADLWWTDKEDILQYYERGPYFQALGPLQSLNPVVLEYCSVFQKFYGTGSMTGDFQDSDRVASRARLLQQLLAAVGRPQG